MGIAKDARIGNRLGRLSDAMVEKNSSVINSFCESHAERIAAYRLLSNSRLVINDMVETLSKDCSSHCKDLMHVLCIQDTTEIDYTSHSGRLSLEDKDFGYGTNKLEEFTIFAHPCLVVDADSRMPVGFGSMEIWNRDRSELKARQGKHAALKLEQKESRHWAEMAEKSSSNLPASVRKTMVGDRENDVYTVMWRTLDCGCDFLIRSLHNRPVDEGGLGIREYMRGLPFSHTYELELQGHKGRKARKALMHLRFAKVTIRKAPTCADEVPDELTCYCVHAMEDASTVPEGEEPIEWRLLTSHVVETIDQAVQCVEWYKCRWFIEELFRVCKSEGFRIEATQLETGIAIKRLIVLTLYAALRCVTLKRAYDEQDETVPAERMFNEEEKELLELEMERLHNKSPRAIDGRNPFAKNSLPWAAWIIARMGGWSGYTKSHGRPGYITMKRGLEVFNQHMRIHAFAKGRNVYKE